MDLLLTTKHTVYFVDKVVILAEMVMDPSTADMACSLTCLFPVHN